MEKTIDFAPYNRAVVKELCQMGVLCDLYGENMVVRDIIFPPESTILELTEQEKQIIKARKTEV